MPAPPQWFSATSRTLPTARPSPRSSARATPAAVPDVRGCSRDRSRSCPTRHHAVPLPRCGSRSTACAGPNWPPHSSPGRLTGCSSPETNPTASRQRRVRRRSARSTPGDRLQQRARHLPHRASGAAGNVHVGQLSQPLDRPLGLKGVYQSRRGHRRRGSPSRNPMRACRSRSGVRTLGRAVSLRDYADFALAFTGIGKASADRAVAARRCVRSWSRSPTRTVWLRRSDRGAPDGLASGTI